MRAQPKDVIPISERGAGVEIAGSDAPERLPAALALAFAPLHKRAFGIAIGTALALTVGAVTLFHVLLDPVGAPPVGLLREFFYGYSVSWSGVLIGLLWGFTTGFIMGWFVAFCRNFVIAVSLFIFLTRAELRATREFLDHI